MKISINSVFKYNKELEENSTYAKIAHMGNNANNEVCNLEVVQEQKVKSYVSIALFRLLVIW